jgi:hypothetical protein
MLQSLTSDLEKQYQVVWYSDLWFGFYSVYKVFLQHDATTLTSDLEKQYQVVWYSDLWFGFYPVYKVFLKHDVTTLTIDLWPWKTILLFLSSWWSCMILCNLYLLVVGRRELVLINRKKLNYILYFNIFKKYINKYL